MLKCLIVIPTLSILRTKIILLTHVKNILPKLIKWLKTYL